MKAIFAPMKAPSPFDRRNRRPQQGLALLVALLVLVAMSLAAVGLMRSVDTASLIAGNLAFRQGATLAADAGIEDARSFLLSASSATLQQNDSGSGYYATSQDSVDLTGNKTINDNSDDVKWPGTDGAGIAPKCLATDGAGNKVCYVAHRLCTNLGAVDMYTCSTRYVNSTGGGTTGPNSGGVAQQQRSNQGSSPAITTSGSGGTGSVLLVYYRVTVRVAGPRNNVSFVQAFLLI